MSFSDPSHPLLDLGRELEAATDEYVAALNDEAIKENAYLRAFNIQYAKASAAGVAVTGRSKEADSVPEVVEALCDWNLAKARAKSCKAKCEQLSSRLMAAQSYHKLVGLQS